MAGKSKLSTLSAAQYHNLRKARWKARTDLGWLCREILNYPDVSDDNGGSKLGLHTHLINTLQKFPSPNQKQFDENDRIIDGKWCYTPITKLEELPGKRRTLILDFRASLKTTINSVAHTIQWILNYPNIAILVFMGADEKASDVLSEIKGHFQWNPLFRELFPEHCPQKSIADWGRADRFISEARDKSYIRKEPTLMTGAVQKGAAGYHFDVIKFSDIVDENNIAGTGLEQVRKKFDISINLLKGTNYWMDVEGTRYHFGDTYGHIIKREFAKPETERAYNVHFRSVFKRNIPGGETFTLEDIKYPYKLDEKGKRIPWWPEKWSLQGLEDEEKNDPWLFACQKLNTPIVSEEGMQNFPVNEKFPVKITPQDFYDNVRIAYKEICIDLAETDNQRSNYTAIVVGAVDTFGRLYIEEIIHGRFLADKVIKIIFQTALKHRSKLNCLKFEETSYLRGLMPSILRELDTVYRPHGIDFPIQTIKRSSKQHKNDRISKYLQPRYHSGDLRFVSSIFTDSNGLPTEVGQHLETELQQFPAGETDDILDAMADFLADKEYFGREQPRGYPQGFVRNRAGLIDYDNEDVAAKNARLRENIFKRVQSEAFDKLLQINNPYEDTKDFSTMFHTDSQRGIL